MNVVVKAGSLKVPLRIAGGGNVEFIACLFFDEADQINGVRKDGGRFKSGNAVAAERQEIGNTPLAIIIEYGKYLCGGQV